MNSITKVALVDDHKALREGLAHLIGSLDYQVVFQADNGKDLMEKIEMQSQPDVVLMDINMPQMDGYEATLWLRKNHPFINVLALSMYDDENAIIRMIRNGAKGFMVKDVEPREIKTAIDAVMNKGFYYSDLVSGRLLRSIRDDKDSDWDHKLVRRLSEREIEFLKLASTEMTYKQIADQMHLSPRTIDGYRDALFEKLGVKSRVGLVLFAIKNSIVQVK